MKIVKCKQQVNCIDWNEEWKAAKLNASMEKRRKDKIGFWNTKARRYGSFSNSAEERAEQVIQKMGINADASVIDIGCGPGTLSVPLARKAKSVTAIDPSYKMLEMLEEKAARAGRTNITTINKAWEDIKLERDIGLHDTVVASYSLIMNDIKKALGKMDAAARRGVCLFWFAGKRGGLYNDLWPKLFGGPYEPGPDYIFLLNVLYQMGIYPNVEITKTTHEQSFSSLDDAVENWKENFQNLTPGQLKTLRSSLQEALLQKDGILISRNSVNTAMIWWKTRAKS